MKYVDGFLIAVPATKKQAYVDQAAAFAPIFKELGATRVVECWGDDVPGGKVTSFGMAVKAEPDEVVVFAWIEYPSKEVRDAAVEKMKTDERMLKTEMPFDAKRMIFGGFVPVVDSEE